MVNHKRYNESIEGRCHPRILQLRKKNTKKTKFQHTSDDFFEGITLARLCKGSPVLSE